MNSSVFAGSVRFPGTGIRRRSSKLFVLKWNPGGRVLELKNLIARFGGKWMPQSLGAPLRLE
jgi:hypothetical protein